MGLFRKSNDSQYADNTAARLQSAIDRDDVDEIEKVIKHMVSEGDITTDQATVAALKRRYGN